VHQLAIDGDLEVARDAGRRLRHRS
jgi:hypothetical protein